MAYLRGTNEGQTDAVVNEVIIKPDISKVKMSALWPDTHPEVERLQIERLRQTPDWRKMELMAEMGQSVRTLALAGLRQRYPTDTPAQRRRRLADLLLGPDLAARAYGPAVEED